MASTLDDATLYTTVNTEISSCPDPAVVDAWNEIVARWHQAQQLVSSMATTVQAPVQQPTGTGTLAASKVKLSPPTSFDGNPKNLSNFLFSVRTYAGVLGISMETEQVKLAVTLLEGRALTWWRSVASEAWATLGVCDWASFEQKISE